MAEGRRSQHPTINVNVHLIQDGDTIRNIRKRSTRTTNINAVEIGHITTSGEVGERARGGEEEEEGYVQEDGDAPDYASPPAKMSKMSSSEDVASDSQSPAAKRGTHSTRTDDQDFPLEGNVTSDCAASSFGPSNTLPDTTGTEDYRKKLRKTKATTETEAKMKAAGSDVQAFILKERASLLMEESKFGAAYFLLEKLLSMQDHNRLEIQLMMAECNLQLEREELANDVIKDIRNRMMTSPRPKYSDVLTLAENYQKKKHYIRALILYQCLCELYKLDASPNDAVRGIYNECVYQSSIIVKAMVAQGDRLRAIASDFVIPSMHDMMEVLGQITGGSLDTKAKCHSWCLNSIGLSYGEVGKKQEAITHEQKGVDIMRRQFGSKASKYRVLGSLLNNIGVANDDLAKYSVAESFYLQSIEAYEQATDWASQDEKTKSIELTKKNLKIVRDKMKK